MRWWICIISTSFSIIWKISWWSRMPKRRWTFKSIDRTTIRTPKKIEKMRQKIAIHTKVSVRLNNKLKVGKDTIRDIWTIDLNERKSCARFVPNVKTYKQKFTRIYTMTISVKTLLKFFKIIEISWNNYG